jgi:hypothetical protein
LRRFEVPNQYSREDLMSPEALLSAPRELFPQFGDDELVEDVASGEATLLPVMSDVCSEFDAIRSEERQLAQLASLLQECVRIEDNLENAVGTCFLEHVDRSARHNPLWSHLAPEVKTYIRTH